jgi:hypothetical protein
MSIKLPAVRCLQNEIMNCLWSGNYYVPARSEIVNWPHHIGVIQFCNAPKHSVFEVFPKGNLAFKYTISWRIFTNSKIQTIPNGLLVLPITRNKRKK